MNITKEKIRTYYVNKRKKISFKLKQKIDNAVFKIFINSSFMSYKIYHCFLPIKRTNEFNTYLLIDYLLDQKKMIIVPKIVKDNLEHYYFNESSKLQNNQWNIPEPINAKLFFSLNCIEVVLVPLLICDIHGNRVGYGKGYYDRFLSNLSKNTLKIGINVFNCIEKIPKEEHDITLDYLVSPCGIINFKIDNPSPKSIQN